MNKSRPTETGTREDISSIDPAALGFTRVAYTINQTVELIGIGRTSIYAAIKRGDLKFAKSGKRTLLLACDLASYLDTLRVKAKDNIGAGENSGKLNQPTRDASANQRERASLKPTWPVHLQSVHVGDLEVDGAGGIAAYSIGPQGRTRIGTFRTRLEAERAVRGVRT